MQCPWYKTYGSTQHTIACNMKGTYYKLLILNFSHSIYFQDQYYNMSNFPERLLSGNDDYDDDDNDDNAGNK